MSELVETHPSSCFDAKTTECNCACGGKYHGRKSGNLTDKVAKNINQLCVGDIVISYCEGSTFGKKGFVEEIVRDPDERTGLLWHHGKYSIYGLEPLEALSGNHHYYGDHLGYQLEFTGKQMTRNMLREWTARVGTGNMGIQQDVKIVLKNLGRRNGRNQS